MVKAKVNWHTTSAKILKKDIVLERFNRYLRGIGLCNETVKLYMGRLNAFLDYAKQDEPAIEVASDYRDMLIGKRFSRTHINNTCFAIKKFYQMNNIDWNFTFLKPNEGVPYYFDEKDVQALFSVCSNIEHLAMLKTLFYGCLRSSELCKLDDEDLDLKARTIHLRATKGGRDGIIYVKQECIETLLAYLKEMIHALLEKDEFSRENISEMARGKLKSKVPQLIEALNGRVTEHHRFLLKFHLDNIAFQLEQIQELDEEIQRRMVPFQKEYRLIQTLPGISKTSAAAIIAEIGTDMSQFPDEAHLSSWAGMCPGNNERAGVKKSGKTRKGNGFLKGILTEVAWAASRTKSSAYSAIYNGIAKRRGKKRALIALGHRILCDIYRVLATGEVYVDEGAEAIFKINSKAREWAMIRALERAGYAITKVPA